MLNSTFVVFHKASLSQYELEFIETRRFTSKHQTDHGFNMLNLVEGQTALVESPKNEFESYTVHYAETFIVPANIRHINGVLVSPKLRKIAASKLYMNITGSPKR